MKVTIKRIAQECNLSTTAVSLVLNGKPNRISMESRALIQDTAKRLHYRPNQIAVGLVSGRTNTIGLILSDISNLFLARVARIIEEQVQKYDYTVIFGNTADSGKRELAYIQEFLDKNVDGIILLHSSETTGTDEQNIKEVIESSSVPFVMLDNDLRGLKIPRCMLDNKKGGYIATEHLLQLGHRRIGSLLGPMEQCSVRDRLKGYRQALADWEIPYDRELMFQGDFTIDSGVRALPYFLDKGATAVFCYNDMMAYGVYTYARAHGIRIGTDISVVGYDDSFLNELLEVPLTSVIQPLEEMTQKATEKLIAMIQGGCRDLKPVIYQPVLNIRESASFLDGRDIAGDCLENALENALDKTAAGSL